MVEVVGLACSGLCLDIVCLRLCELLRHVWCWFSVLAVFPDHRGKLILCGWDAILWSASLGMALPYFGIELGYGFLENVNM